MPRFLHPSVTATRGQRWRLVPGLAMGVCALLAGAAIAMASEGGAARVSLLPAGARASVVVELDDAASGATPATAIEATDNHTVAVEIGPVRGKVANQLLQAAADTPLVSQVRVRGVTQGTAGTVVTIHIVAKSPISGSVRRTARRIYIDLAPRTVDGPSSSDTGPRVVTDPKPRPVPDSRTARNTTPAVSAPTASTATAPIAKPAPATAPAAAPGAMSATAARKTVPASSANVAARATGTSGPSLPSVTTGPVMPTDPTKAANSAAPTASTPAATTPVPAPYAARLPPAPERTATLPRPENGTAAPALNPVSPQPSPAASPLSEFEARANRLVQTADVRGLSRLKTEIEARKVATAGAAASADFEGLLGRVDQFIDAAQRNRLAADAELFRTSGGTSSSAMPATGGAPSGSAPAAAPTAVASPSPTPSPVIAPAAATPAMAAAPTLAVPPPPPAPGPVPALDGRPANVLTPAAAQAATAQAVPDFAAEFRPVRPQLEQLGRAARTWRESSPTPQDLASVSAVVAQLRMLHPPPHLAASFSNLRTSLELLELWGGASRTPTPSEVALIERARQAIESFLTLDRQSGQSAQ